MHHGEFLRAASRDDHLVYHIQHDYTRAELDEADRAMVDYVVKLNFEPGKVTADDVQALRDAGFDDRGIFDIVMVTAMFNFMNRLADGLGVEPEAPFLKAKQRAEQRIATGRAKAAAAER